MQRSAVGLGIYYRCVARDILGLGRPPVDRSDLMRLELSYCRNCIFAHLTDSAALLRRHHIQ
jgi:hypothetical protein